MPNCCWNICSGPGSCLEKMYVLFSIPPHLPELLLPLPVLLSERQHFPSSDLGQKTCSAILDTFHIPQTIHQQIQSARFQNKSQFPPFFPHPCRHYSGPSHHVLFLNNHRSLLIGCPISTRHPFSLVPAQQLEQYWSTEASSWSSVNSLRRLSIILREKYPHLGNGP